MPVLGGAWSVVAWRAVHGARAHQDSVGPGAEFVEQVEVALAAEGANFRFSGASLLSTVVATLIKTKGRMAHRNRIHAAPH